MKVDELKFKLPFHLQPGEPREVRGEQRDQSRLLVLKRKTQEVEYSFFYRLGSYLNPGDLLVLNDTKSLKSILAGKLDSGGKLEVRLCTRKENDIWHCELLPREHAKIGQTVTFGNGELTAKIIGKRPEFDWLWIMQFSHVDNFEEVVNKLGRPVLSPYIRKIWDLKYYNTVYASKSGSAEMPAAGRHFTFELLDSLKQKGINHVFVTLHTGLSSIDVKEENFENHKMYEEEYEVTPETARIINEAKANGERIVAVGTTVTRTLETAADADGIVKAQRGWTELYIYPGYKWKIVDALITNFHPPRSTRIALAAAFAGKELLLKGYREAIAKGYGFYEFGDTTLTI